MSKNERENIDALYNFSDDPSSVLKLIDQLNFTHEAQVRSSLAMAGCLTLMKQQAKIPYRIYLKAVTQIINAIEAKKTEIEELSWESQNCISLKALLYDATQRLAEICRQDNAKVAEDAVSLLRIIELIVRTFPLQTFDPSNTSDNAAVKVTEMIKQVPGKLIEQILPNMMHIFNAILLNMQGNVLTGLENYDTECYNLNNSQFQHRACSIGSAVELAVVIGYHLDKNTLDLSKLYNCKTFIGKILESCYSGDLPLWSVILPLCTSLCSVKSKLNGTKYFNEKSLQKIFQFSFEFLRSINNDEKTQVKIDGINDFAVVYDKYVQANNIKPLQHNSIIDWAMNYVMSDISDINVNNIDPKLISRISWADLNNILKGVSYDKQCNDGIQKYIAMQIIARANQGVNELISYLIDICYESFIALPKAYSYNRDEFMSPRISKDDFKNPKEITRSNIQLIGTLIKHLNNCSNELETDSSSTTQGALLTYVLGGMQTIAKIIGYDQIDTNTHKSSLESTEDYEEEEEEVDINNHSLCLCSEDTNSTSVQYIIAQNLDEHFADPIHSKKLYENFIQHLEVLQECSPQALGVELVGHFSSNIIPD